MGGGGGGETTTVTKSDPWEGQQGYLRQALGEAQKLYNTQTAQYDQDAYNQALQTWETSNAGNPVQYDQNAYNQALSQYNSSGTPIRIGNGGMDIATAMQQKKLNPEQIQGYNDWVKRTGGGGAYEVPGSASGPTGPAPTLEQFVMAGTGSGQPKPTLEQFAIPGTSGNMLTPQAFQGKTYADFSPETLAAQQLTTNRAIGGSPVTNSANQVLQDTLQGGYLNSNPYLDSAFNRGADQVQQRVNSAFGQGGRFGSGINQEVFTREMGNVAADVYGKNYDSERTRQMQSMLFAPQMANQDYYDISQLAGVGAQKEGQAQLGINDQINRFNLEQQAPLTALQRYQQLINGNFGGTTSATQPYYQNQTAGALGGAMSGASMGSMFGPWGTAIGGGIGLLGGLFG